MKVAHTLDIGAPIEEVWSITADIERWPDVTPTMTSVERLDDGELGIGSKARIKQPGMMSAVWTVTEFEPPLHFVWEAKLGAMRIVAEHHLESTDTGCRNTLVVELSGLGSRLLGAIGKKRLQRAIAVENEGFKRAAEA